MKVYCRGNILFNEVGVANNFISRFVGLMGKKSIENNEGLLLMKCPSIHCFFMKFPIDVVYLSKDMTVLHIETIKPWKIGKGAKKTSHVLELAEGTSQGVSIGDKLLFDE